MQSAAGSGYRAVLFDALGTLVELELPWPHLRRVLSTRHGIDVTEDAAREAMLAEMAYYRAHHMDGADDASLADLRRRCATVLRERLTGKAPGKAAGAGTISLDELTEALLDSLRFVPYADAAPTLAALRDAGLRLAIVSNWDCSLRGVLAGLGLSAAADAVVVSAEVGAAKPDPRIYEAALARLRSAPEQAVFVGDSLETDIAGARRAGMRAILLDRAGKEPPAGKGMEAIHSLGDLPALIAAGGGLGTSAA